MKMPALARLGTLAFLALLIVSVTSALAASNTIAATRLDDDTVGIGVNDLKPSVCNGINLTNLVVVSGLGFGTAGADLILGTGSGDIIFGLGGNDCIISGGGDDLIFAGAGADVCDGGPGNDTAFACETEISIP